MLRYNHEISNDLHMLNSLERCFKLTPEVVYSTSADFMIAHVFKQEKIMHYQNLMMNIMPYMLDSSEQSKEYSEFFTDDKYDPLHESIKLVKFA